MTEEDIERIVERILSRPIKLQYKLLHQSARTPERAKPGDSCYDVWATSISHESNYIEYGTGLSFNIPPGYELKVYPRSSVSGTSLILANGVGVIDEGYKGELMIRFKAVAPYTGKRYILGDRIAQIQLVKKVPTELENTNEIGTSVRGTGGHGSTGKK